MAFPTVAQVTQGTNGSNTTSHPLTMPSPISAGDQLVVAIQIDGNTTITNFDGFTEIARANQSGNLTIYVLRKTAVGSDTCTLTTDASEASSHFVFRFTNWHGTSLPTATATQSASDDQNPNPPSHTASWGAADNLWIAACAINNSSTSVTAYPTDYTANNLYQSVSAGGPNGGAAAVAVRTINGATQDPATFTIDSANPWCAATAVVRGTAAAAADGAAVYHYLRQMGA